MFAAGLQRFILGLILSIPVSPIFFLLISTSIEKGFKNALALESGIITSDILCIFIIYFGLADFISRPIFQIPVYIAGGVFLIIIGLINLIKKSNFDYGDIQVVPQPLTSAFLKGFVLNLSNPAVTIFWLGAVSIALTQFKSTEYAVGIYFSFAISTVLLFDIFKAWMADYIRKWLTQKQIAVISKTSGIAMGLFGIYLFTKGVNLYYE